MSLTIQGLLEGGRVTPEQVDRFLGDRAVPIVEGSRTTFLYRGQADEVLLQHWIHGLPSAQPFAPVAGSDLWYLVLDLPSGSRVEYKLVIRRAGREETIKDPLNPLEARDPFGANSVCHSGGYAVPDWTEPDPTARPGWIEPVTLRSAALASDVRIGVYHPARFRPQRRYPLLVVHDGRDYLRFADFQTVLDNLIHRLEIAPMIVAMVDPVGNRLEEYADDENHARFLTEELGPALERRFPLEGRPGARGLMGASFGAVAALSTACRYPGYYGRLLLQSGSFAFTDIGANRRGPAFDPVVEFVNRYRDSPVLAAEQVFVSCGTYESLIYENRSLVPVLRDAGMRVRYVEARDGHNWVNWRDRLREGLSWLFPGPLWMVYE